MDRYKLKKLLLQSAGDHIDQLLSGSLKTEPISSGEAEAIEKALSGHTLSIEHGCFQIADRSWSIWTLNREYWTHVSCYLNLISTGIAEPDQIKIEQNYMDLVVYDKGKPKIAIEIKVKEKEAESLISKIQSMSLNPPLKDRDRGNDPLRKIKSILELRPQQFWVVAPNESWKFLVHFEGSGFRLEAIEAQNIAA